MNSLLLDERKPGIDSRRVQTDSGAQLATFPTGTGIVNLEVMWSGRYRSRPSSAYIENVWSFTSTPLYTFMVCFLIKQDNNFIWTHSLPTT
jgi:hypothetical protein